MARQPRLRIGVRRTTRPISSAGLLLAALAIPVEAAQVDIAGPPGSSAFGTHVAVLPNGNIVVTDPSALGPALKTAAARLKSATGDPLPSPGAVYLYSPTGTLISTLTGSGPNDQVGSGGVVVLANGNFLVRSTNWDNGGATDAGAVTWVDGDTGLSGVVSAANSLVGTATEDFVGFYFAALGNGNYVVVSPRWDNGPAMNAGAATWGNGSTGIAGVVSSANSLVGTTAGDFVGEGGAKALRNGNYVLVSPFWDNATVDAGASTWANGSSGLVGTVSPANSLVGTSSFDQGNARVAELDNGNYVVASPGWDNGAAVDAGAVTWANGTTGRVAAISSANSLIGTTTGDRVGSVVIALGNGNYVNASADWDNGATVDVGAATWANGSVGLSGPVVPANSLIGSTTGDQVGFCVALGNGHYVVLASSWDDGATVDVGAVTWADGNTGLTGVVSSANSLVGTTAGNSIGRFAVALRDGNYVVQSPDWDNGPGTDVGAATWANGGTALVGAVSPANSLIGTAAGDRVGELVVALGNGNYVVGSRQWNNGAAADVGAVTWGNGNTGLVGAVSPANSLIGTTAGDSVGGTVFSGSPGVVALGNGNYVVASLIWDNGAAMNAGAVTWANGSTGLTGVVSPGNSLVGTTAGDQVGSVTALADGRFVVRSFLWDNSGIVNAGAVTLGNDGLSGTIGPANSVQGTTGGGGLGMVFAYDAARRRLAVGRPGSNVVSLFDDIILGDGFE